MRLIVLLSIIAFGLGFGCAKAQQPEQDLQNLSMILETFTTESPDVQGFHHLIEAIASQGISNPILREEPYGTAGSFSFIHIRDLGYFSLKETENVLYIESPPGQKYPPPFENMVVAITLPLQGDPTASVAFHPPYPSLEGGIDSLQNREIIAGYEMSVHQDGYLIIPLLLKIYKEEGNIVIRWTYPQTKKNVAINHPLAPYSTLRELLEGYRK